MFKRGSKQKLDAADGLSDPVDELFDAVRRVNEAWAEMPRDVNLWIDWRERRIVVQTKQMTVENHSRNSLRDELERRQAHQ